jgi:DUF1680 family protein
MSNKTDSKRLSRREFGTLVAAFGAGVPALVAQQQPQQNAQANPQQQSAAAQAAQRRRRRMVPDTPPFEGTLEFNRKDVPAKAQPFPMKQVRLLPSVYHDAHEWNRGYMSRLAADRLLYNFRANAGLPVGSTEPLGGWERPDNSERSSELRGHFTGHFLTASAQFYASMDDQEAKSKADYMVAELAKCQQKLGGKYLSAFPATFWDRLDRRERVWAPFYTIHKIMAGLLDMYQLAGNKQALQVLEGMAAWADEWTASKTEEHMQEILTTEYGGIGETLYDLAAETNNDRWAKAGDRFQKKVFINPLAMRRDELQGLHVNTHIPQVIAAARRYEISDDLRFRDVADYFFYEVATARSYVTGGTSNGEGWLAPPNRLAAELKLSVSTAECCCAYNMLKLARHLYSWDPDPKYFDYYERLLLNHRIGTIRPKERVTQYYLSLTPGTWKTFNTEDQSFWCCTGSGVEEYSKLNDSIFPSELDWTEKGFKLRQETKYPESQTTTLRVTEARPGALAMRLRIPGWLKSAPTVKLNGKVLDASAAPGSYLTLNRTWKAGDKVEMDLPMHLHIEAMPDDSTMQAILYGPLVMAGDLGAEGLTKAHIIGPNRPPIFPRPRRFGSSQRRPDPPPPVPKIEIPTFKAASADPSSWIKPGDQPLAFRTTGQQKDVILVPLNSILDRRYSVYWQVS